MKNLINKNQNNVAQNLNNKGENTMTRNSLKANEGFDRKLGTAHQQNLIEMTGYIYQYPKACTKKNLAEEFIKNGIVSERKIIRMVNDIHTFCPIIKRVIGKIDFESHYYLDEKRFTEIDLDNFYQKIQNAELLYIFLVALLIKPISTEEVMQKVNLSRKKANEMLNKILDASYLLDEFETDKGLVIGNTRFF